MTECTPNQQAERLSEALQGKAIRGGWRAHCPAHDDHEPSLDITIKGGRVLWICRAGCDQPRVLEALRDRGLYPPERPPEAAMNGQASHRPSAVYHFFTTAGEQVTFNRFEWMQDGARRKRFAWVGADGTSGLKGAKPLIYRSEKLRTLPHDVPIVWVEGPKCVELVESRLGFAATSGYSGTTITIGDEDILVLKGHEVWILPDNNKEGREHAEGIRDRLKAAGIATVYIELPGLPPKGDVEQWLQAGGTKEQFLELVEQARANGGSPKCISVRDLMRKDLPPLRWAIPDLLPEGAVLLVGAPKIGKSWVALHTALAIGYGGQVLGQVAVQQGGVLYLALEDSERRLQDRIRMQCQECEPPEDVYLATAWDRVDEGGLEQIRAFVAAHPRTRFVIVDTLKRIRPVVPGQKSVYDADYEAVMGLQALAAELHLAILILHHKRKAAADDPADEISGSNGLLAAADGAWILDRTRGESEAEMYVINRETEDQHLMLTWSDALHSFALAGGAEEYQGTKQRREIVELLRDAEEPMAPREIAEALGRDTGSTKALLYKMRRDDEVHTAGRGQYVVGRALNSALTVDFEARGGAIFPRPDAKNSPSEKVNDGQRWSTADGEVNDGQRSVDPALTEDFGVGTPRTGDSGTQSQRSTHIATARSLAGQAAPEDEGEMKRWLPYHDSDDDPEVI